MADQVLEVIVLRIRLKAYLVFQSNGECNLDLNKQLGFVIVFKSLQYREI